MSDAPLLLGGASIEGAVDEIPTPADKRFKWIRFFDANPRAFALAEELTKGIGVCGFTTSRPKRRRKDDVRFDVQMASGTAEIIVSVLPTPSTGHWIDGWGWTRDGKTESRQELVASWAELTRCMEHAMSKRWRAVSIVWETPTQVDERYRLIGSKQANSV